MRAIIIIIIFVIVAISIQVDLTTGTIPSGNSNLDEKEFQAAVSENDEIDEHIPASTSTYQEVIVEHGQTVYGVVQQLHDKETFNIPLQDVLTDFEKLNEDISASQLIAGEAYKFPIYEEPAID